MRTLTRRIELLEHNPGTGPFDHLSDDELSEELNSVVEQLREQGMELPDDWRDQFNRNPWPLMAQLAEEVE